MMRIITYCQKNQHITLITEKLSSSILMLKADNENSEPA